MYRSATSPRADVPYGNKLFSPKEENNLIKSHLVTLFYKDLITRQISNDSHKIVIFHTVFKQYPWPVKVHLLNNFARVLFGVWSDVSTVNYPIILV